MMANRSENRYALPPGCFGADATLWVAGNPFFWACAVKYVYRGWNHLDDMQKARDCLVKSIIHEPKKADTRMMRLDLSRPAFHHTLHDAHWLQTLHCLSAKGMEGPWDFDRALSEIAGRVGVLVNQEILDSERRGGQ